MTERSKIFAFAWAIVVAALLGAFISMARGGFAIETNLLELLPKDERNPILTKVTKTFMREVGQRIAILVGAPEIDRAAEAADRLEAELRGSPSFSRVMGAVAPSEPADSSSTRGDPFESLYFPHKEALLGESLNAILLSAEPLRGLAARVEAILSSPMTGAVTRHLSEDPFLFYPDALSRIPPPPGSIRLEDGRLALDVSDSLETGGYSTHFLVSAVLSENVFAREAQRAASEAVDLAIASTLAAFPDVSISQLGALRFAKRMADEAESDISLIGVGSILGTALLVIVSFFSVQPLVLSVLTVLVGVLCALTVSLLVFPSVHVLTLGFGASLIGVCADYSFHFFCHRFSAHRQSSAETVRAVMPGISIGVATSVLGYLGLLAVPFPGLNQMAVFAVAGMIGSYLCVVCWFPLLPPDAREPREPLVLRWSHNWLTFARTSRARGAGAVLALAASPLIAFGLSEVRANDDVRILQKPPPDLVTEERRFRELLGNADTSRFFAVLAPDAERALRAEEALVSELGELKSAGVLEGFQAVSSLLPSAESQSRNLRLVRNAILPRQAEALSALEAMGFRAEDVGRYIERLAGDLPLLLPNEWIESDGSLPLRHLWLGEIGGRHVTLVPLFGVRDEERISALQDPERGIYHLDLVDDASSLIGRYRRSATYLISACYIAVFLLLAARYGARRGALGMIPALASVVIGFAFQGLTGQPLTLFSVLANAIVLGLAIDYSVFLLEGMDAEGPTMMAIVLSALTTILSFGLLALSSTAVLRSFGTSLFVGVTVAMTLCPLLVRRDGE